MADARIEGGWDAHRDDQRKRWRATTPDERMQWLRRMQEFAFRAGAWPKRDDAATETTRR